MYFMQNILFKTKCVLWEKYNDRQNMSCLKQNVLYDQNVDFQWMHDAIFGYKQGWSWCMPGFMQ